MNIRVEQTSIYEQLFKNSIGKLKENIKTMDEVIKILQGKYEVVVYENEEFTQKVINNMRNKYGNDEDYVDKDNIVTFEFKTNENSYYVGFNKKNNGFFVEGSEWLKIQLIILRGLNQNELHNIFLVGEYLYYTEEVYAV